eukprot:CAMPEP_0115224824 /NCGR_PEP_ID=MMETSP0270-20121206/29770_1 /TAXON_ID=71861 /ORGANISM="Scrippsiella trochoidea, Strain CCMP3099" /LENGTH=275 /DNA_ID=CAMNT_0002639139 /DNA_START=36 /DNA_END=859 /DNA_ORIENTATION=+
MRTYQDEVPPASQPLRPEVSLPSATTAAEAPARESLPQIVTPRSTRPAQSTAAVAEASDNEDDETCPAGSAGHGAQSRTSSCGATPLNSHRSRGVEEHRVDPALRAALERLDAVRQGQPSMDDFALENFLGRTARRSGSVASSHASLLGAAPQEVRSMSSMSATLLRRRGSEDEDEEDDGVGLEEEVDAYLRQSASSTAAPPSLRPRGEDRDQRRGLRACFSTDVLMAAARSTPGGPPASWLTDASRSTSPGSTQLSGASLSGGSLSDGGGGGGG